MRRHCQYREERAQANPRNHHEDRRFEEAGRDRHARQQEYTGGHDKRSHNCNELVAFEPGNRYTCQGSAHNRTDRERGNHCSRVGRRYSKDSLQKERQVDYQPDQHHQLQERE